LAIGLIYGSLNGCKLVAVEDERRGEQTYNYQADKQQHRCEHSRETKECVQWIRSEYECYGGGYEHSDELSARTPSK